MSDALNFLVKARPAAMTHYFSFLKDCGKQLDPKTRDLISVITKVHSQTERGFRQYRKRVLRRLLGRRDPGCDADGLSGARTGQDRLGRGHHPGDGPPGVPQRGVGRRRPMARPHGQCRPRARRHGGTARIECDGRGLFVHHGAEGWKVFDSRCPHQTTNIPHLALCGATLTCPKHEWAFDIRSGQCTAKGDTPLKQWDSKVVDGRLLARW